MRESIHRILSTSVVGVLHHNLCHYVKYIIRSPFEHWFSSNMITHTILIVQIFTHTNVSPLSPYFHKL